MDRDFVRTQVLRVMADWGVTPSGRGTGEGDVENWIDYILDVSQQRPPSERGWNSYWEDVRMPREFLANGHTKGSQPAPPPPVPSGDPYMPRLNAIESKVDYLTSKLSKYF